LSAAGDGILVLHRYFLWANQMRLHFLQEVGKHEPEEAIMYPYMSYYYSGAYAVVEGWRELGLSDPAIDDLLRSPNVDLLRRYRNGAFHFQREYFDPRFRDFIGEGGSARWIANLWQALDGWFLDYFKERASSR